jgi:hypothetical protein
MSDYAYHKRWTHERAHGHLRTVDVAPVRAHIHALLALGWSLRSIGDAARCSPSIVWNVKENRQKRIRKHLAEQLLAVTDAAILARGNDAGFVRNFGARRRIAALLAIGWRHEDITHAMHASDASLGTTSALALHQKGNWIARSTHDAVCAAFERLSATPGPSGKTRRLAAKYGYAPPLAWDDGALDNPDARPELGGVDTELDDVVVQRLMNGTLRLPAHSKAPELVEAVRRLAAAGLNDTEIGERIDRTNAAVLKVRIRHDIANGTAPRGVGPTEGVLA